MVDPLEPGPLELLSREVRLPVGLVEFRDPGAGRPSQPGVRKSRCELPEVDSVRALVGAGVARELPKAERDRIYAEIVERAPGFGEYEKRTDRVIPVFELAAS